MATWTKAIYAIAIFSFFRIPIFRYQIKSSRDLMISFSLDDYRGSRSTDTVNLWTFLPSFKDQTFRFFAQGGVGAGVRFGPLAGPCRLFQHFAESATSLSRLWRVIYWITRPERGWDRKLHKLKIAMCKSCMEITFLTRIRILNRSYLLLFSFDTKFQYYWLTTRRICSDFVSLASNCIY